MNPTKLPSLSGLKKRLAPFGQEHLVAFWEELNADQKMRLAGQIVAIDFDQIAELYQTRDQATDFDALLEEATPPDAFRLDTTKNRFTPEEALARGQQALAAGQLGVILVAGGQGTRLGFPHPKGMFPIGPISGKTLLQIHCEKVIALGRQYGRTVPLYLMTSPATHDETVAFLESNDRFGIAEEDLTVFCQGTMPAVDRATGKILLDEKGSLALSPDGHGGMLAALSQSGAMVAARARGVESLFYFQVDNPLVDIGDEIFLGYHLLSDSALSSEVVAKRDPLEKVGNIVKVGDRLHVVEYSDLPESFARRRNPDGSLEIWAGSIAVHVMNLAFLEAMVQKADSLPFHIAQKKVSYLDPTGTRHEPSEPNAVKFERFIFDLLPSAPRSIVVEIDPAKGFAPLKNASEAGTDCPETVRAAMLAEQARWLREAGCKLSDSVEVEISPLFARNGRVLREKVDQIGPIATSCVLE